MQKNVEVGEINLNDGWNREKILLDSQGKDQSTLSMKI